jgi:hypothetical protein
MLGHEQARAAKRAGGPAAIVGRTSCAAQSDPRLRVGRIAGHAALPGGDGTLQIAGTVARAGFAIV